MIIKTCVDCGASFRAAGKSYGYWRLDELLKEQKAREELDNLIERNRERRERKEHEQQQEKA